jgi:AcrR family transcriptional regulator
MSTSFEPDLTDMAKERAVERAVLSARERARTEIGNILEAAWTVLARTGWEDLKIGMVLEEAQVSTRSFYRNFSGKSELLIALFEEEINLFAMQVNADMAETEDPIQKTIIWVSLNLKRAYGPRSHARTKLFAAEGPLLAPEFPDDVRRIRRLLLDPLVHAVEIGSRQGLFTVASPDSAALVIWLLTASLMREPLAGGNLTATYEGALDLVLDSAFRLLGVKRLP